MVVDGVSDNEGMVRSTVKVDDSLTKRKGFMAHHDTRQYIPSKFPSAFSRTAGIVGLNAEGYYYQDRGGERQGDQGLSL